MCPPRLSCRSSAARATHSLTSEHVAQVEREVPAGVELPVALDAEVLGALLELVEPGRAPRSISVCLADDADEVVHRLLQLLVERVGVLAALLLERRAARSPPPRRRPPGRPSAGARPRPCDVCRGAEPARSPNTSRSDSELPPSRFDPCMPPETSPAANRPGTRAAAAGVGVDLDAAHDVVAGRADLHRLRGDVDVGQLLELVVHRRAAAS